MNSRVFPHAERYAFSWTFTLAIFFALAVIVSSGCSVQKSYVKAERAIYDQVAERYKAYTLADPDLGPSVKARRIRTVVAWDARITQAEKP